MEKNYNYNFENRSKAKKTTVVSGNLLVFSCTASELKKNPVSDGRFWHTTDTNEFYYDWNGKRTKLNFTGDSDSINAEIAKIKAEIAKLDPDAVQQKVDILEGKVNTAVSTVNSLKTDVDSAVSSANSASQAAQNAVAQVADKVNASYVDNAIAAIELTPGPKGDKGDAFTYDDFTPEQLAALKGTDGKDGIDGQNGADGKDGVDGQDGVDGKSAFDIAKENGFVGTETEWLESLKGEGLSQADKDLISSIPSDFSTGSFPENVDDESAQSEGYAKVQDVMKYVNALIQKKKDELGPVEPGTPYAYITGYALDGTPTDIMMFNQFELNESGDTELEIWSAKEIGSYDEKGNDLPSIKLTVDIPSDYSIKESYQWNPITNAYALIGDGLFEQNPRYASRTINGVVYNSYVRKVSDPYSVRDNTRYKIIITK